MKVRKMKGDGIQKDETKSDGIDGRSKNDIR